MAPFLSRCNLYTHLPSTTLVLEARGRCRVMGGGGAGGGGVGIDVVDTGDGHQNTQDWPEDKPQVIIASLKDGKFTSGQMIELNQGQNWEKGNGSKHSTQSSQDNAPSIGDLTKAPRELTYSELRFPKCPWKIAWIPMVEDKR
ncbi:hypothetical protein Tco_0628305 [Tanacetum coccineum]|uniref:Uncharacterized protein n=1 Tax=Tanacetum coccineum TaxID=301880 RepID=A0ABQ4WQ36_9ASTR